MTNKHLTDEQIYHYRNEGYLVVDRFFDRARMDKVDQTIRDITDRALAGGDYSKVLELEPEPVNGRRVPRRIFNPFEQHDEFRALATDPESVSYTHLDVYKRQLRRAI